VDTHGNVVQSKIYDYAAGNNPGALLRTYTNTYITDSNYTSRYIFNRLSYTTFSDRGGTPLTLAANWYDQASLTDITSPVPRQHDTAYGASFPYRGNLTTQTSAVNTVTRTYDITGNVKTASDGNLQVSAATGSGNNYAAPTGITPNGNSNLGSTYTFDGALELTGATMPNGASFSASYGGGFPSTQTSVYGAVTNYAYNFNASASTITTSTAGDSGTHWVRSTLDGLGRTIKVEKGTGSGGSMVTLSVQESVYGPCGCSPMGKLTQVSQPHALNAR
jgi:hypothetical protein